MKDVVGTEQVRTYEAMLALQGACLKLDQVEIGGEHLFADGVYAKTMVVPAGTFAIGARHRFSAIHVLTKGRVEMFDGSGNPPKILTAPHTYVSPAGDKKMGIFTIFVEDGLFLENENFFPDSFK